MTYGKSRPKRRPRASVEANGQESRFDKHVVFSAATARTQTRSTSCRSALARNVYPRRRPTKLSEAALIPFNSETSFSRLGA